jgi:hypothetical protein
LRASHADFGVEANCIDAARDAGASEDEAVFDENLKLLAKRKPDKDVKPNKD